MRYRALRGAVVLLALLAGAAGRAEAGCTVVPADDATFGSGTSFAVQSSSFQGSTANAGLNCSGATVTVLQTNDHVYATITSANGGLLGGTGDLVPYAIYGDSTLNYPIAPGVQYDYASGSLLGLLGLFSGPSVNLPLFFRTTAGANVEAGSYTDTLTITWAWNYCSSVGALGICLTRDIGSGTSSFQVSLTVTNACQVSSAPDVSLGQAPTASSFSAVVQSLSVSCTKGLAAFTVGLSAGQSPGSSRRRMLGGGQFLEYDIFKPGGNDVWGEIGAERVSNGSPGNGITPEMFPYRVEIYADQTTPGVGVYSDVVVVDVTF